MRCTPICSIPKRNPARLAIEIHNCSVSTEPVDLQTSPYGKRGEYSVKDGKKITPSQIEVPETSVYVFENKGYDEWHGIYQDFHFKPGNYFLDHLIGDFVCLDLERRADMYRLTGPNHTRSDKIWMARPFPPGSQEEQVIVPRRMRETRMTASYAYVPGATCLIMVDASRSEPQGTMMKETPRFDTKEWLSSQERVRMTLVRPGAAYNLQDPLVRGFVDGLPFFSLVENESGSAPYCHLRDIYSDDPHLIKNRTHE